MSILIGLIHHREDRHPEWSDTYERDPADNIWGTPRTAVQPFLHVGGMWLADLAWAELARARAAGVTWPEYVHPHPEDSYLRLVPGDRGHPEYAGGRVTISACSCGEPQCGSIYARMERTTLGGVEGVMLSDFITRVNEEATLPLPRIFVPLSAWAQGAGAESPYHVLSNGEDVPPADLDTMLADARRAARGLPDPWGRGLGARRWLAVHREERRRHLAELFPPRTEATLRAGHEKHMRDLDADEANARRGVYSHGGFESLLQPPPEMTGWTQRRLEEIAHARGHAEATLARELHELTLSRRDRRVARRARRRELAADERAARGGLMALIEEASAQGVTLQARRRPNRRRPGT